MKTTLLRNFHTGFEAHPTYLSIGTPEALSPLWRKADQSPTHLYLVSRLRMSGVIPPFLLYAFIVLDSENFIFIFTFLGQNRHKYFCILPMTEAETFSDVRYFIFY